MPGSHAASPLPSHHSPYYPEQVSYDEQQDKVFMLQLPSNLRNKLRDT